METELRNYARDHPAHFKCPQTNPICVRAAESSYRQGSRSMSFAASPRFRSSDKPNDVAILAIHPRRRQMSNALLSRSWIGNYGVLVKCQQPLPVVLYYHVCLHLPFILVLHSIFRRYIAVALMNCINQGHVTGYKVNCHTIDRN